MTEPEAGPRVFALLGDPVEHSISPAIHNAAFLQLDLDAVYVTLRVGEGEVGRVMRSVARRGAGRGGGNVTLPHKERAARALDRATADVDATGACNCFWEEDRALVGDNTDVGGFSDAVAALPEVELADGRVLLLGAGGGARAVLRACLSAEVAAVEVLNRTRERATTMVEEVAGDGSSADARVATLGGKEEVGGSYDLVVNATSLGLRTDDPLPLELEGVETRAAFDLVYAPDPGTPWVRHAGSLGIPAADGLEMLVRQAGLSLTRWIGEEPPLDAMRRAARAALEARRAAEGGP